MIIIKISLRIGRFLFAFGGLSFFNLIQKTLENENFLSHLFFEGKSIINI
jgi:hypothetical protein